MKRKLIIYKLLYEAFWILWKENCGLCLVNKRFLGRGLISNLEKSKIYRAIDKELNKFDEPNFLFPCEKKYIFKRLRIFKAILEKVL